jgi:hypothetical protein
MREIGRRQGIKREDLISLETFIIERVIYLALVFIVGLQFDSKNVFIEAQKDSKIKCPGIFPAWVS